MKDPHVLMEAEGTLRCRADLRNRPETPHGSWEVGLGGWSMPYSHLLPRSFLCEWGPLVWRSWCLWVPQLPWPHWHRGSHLPTNLTLVLLMPFLFIPLINYVLNVLLCLQDIGDKTRNCSCPLDSDDRWGRSCYSQPCRAEGAFITQGSYEPYWAGLPKMDRGHSEGFWQNGVLWRRDGKPVQYSCRENLMNSMKR